MIGQTLSHYKVLEEISRGGMGIVYKALDLKLNREVAFKVLPPELVSDPERKRRFVQEAQAAAALKHPNIAVIHEVDEVDGVDFIAMELIEGEKLSDVLARNPLPLSRAVEIAIAVADGLSRAHEKGVVHRDLKPGNIMVMEDGQPKIIDFGLAKLLDREAAWKSELETALKGETRAGQVMGTLAYMSPEQAKGQAVDHRTDIFSFGVALYEMLTGELPFDVESAAEMPHAIIHQPPTPLGDRVSGATAPELQRIVTKCLAKDREERYQTAKDLVVDLRGVKRESDSHSRAVVAMPDPSTSRQRWLVPAAVAVGVLVVVTGLAVLRGESDRPPPRIGRTVQLSREPGLEFHPAISPDGDMVAYAAGPWAQTKIYVQQISGGRAVPLTEELPGRHYLPQWSPDGSQIAFNSWENNRNEAYVIPALGGVPRPLLDAELEGSDAFGQTGGYGPVWSPDGEKLAYVYRSAIYVQDVDESGASTIVDGLASVPSQLSWSPDGTRLAYSLRGGFYVISMNINPSSVWTVSAAGSEPIRITEDAFMDYNPIWGREGTHLFFISNRDGTPDIYRVPVHSSGAPSGPPERLTTGLGVHTMSLSRNGDRLAYSVLESKQNIWSMRIPEAGPVSIDEALAVTTGNQVIEGIDISADGEWLVFDSNRSGNQDIYKMLVAGGEPIQLDTDPADDFNASWSPDGEQVAFHSFRTGNRDIFVMSADGRNVRQITFDEASDRVPDWSPDGARLAFDSTRSGRAEIYVLSVEGDPTERTPRQLTNVQGFWPRWSPTGHWIAFLHDGGAAVVSEDGSETRELVEDAGVEYVGWSRDGRTVYYRAFDPERGTSIWSVPVSGGEPTLLVRHFDPGVRHRPDFAVGAERFFFTLTEHESDVWIMELESQE